MHFLRLSAMPAILLLILFVITDLTGNTASNFLSAIIEIVFVLLWHRAYILGEMHMNWNGKASGNSKNGKKNASQVFGSFFFRSILFAGFGVILALLFSSFLVLAAFTPYLIAVLSIPITIGLFTLISRIILIFPSSATGNTLTVKQAFQCTKGQSFRIVYIYFCVLFPISIVLTLLVAFVAYFSPFYENLAGVIAVNIIVVYMSLILLALGVTTNSIIYCYLCQEFDEQKNVSHQFDDDI